MYEKIDYDLLVEILLKKAEWNLQRQIQTFNKIKHILGSIFFLVVACHHLATEKKRLWFTQRIFWGKKMAQSNHISRIYIFWNHQI
jgi:hypothetical protein